MKKLLSILPIPITLFVSNAAFGGAASGAGPALPLGERLPLWSVVPFIGILLSIALFPLFAPKFWHRHFGKVSAFWALTLAVPFVLWYGEPAAEEIVRVILSDYTPFIILLWSLFTVSGGILVEGNWKGTPLVNTGFLLFGTAIASWIGTTGASMLLIRPLIRSNLHRKNNVHVIVFFIFLISNIGGSLTPLGDPPLFLGFLHGVPFFWTMHNLDITFFITALVALVFYAIDRLLYGREMKSGPGTASTAGRFRIRLRGLVNLVFLGGIVSAVLMSGMARLGAVRVIGVDLERQNLLRDGILVAMGLLSLLATQRRIREQNQFGWGPIREVAVLFAGIFLTIIPALAMLHAGSKGAMGFVVNAVQKPWHYFWVTGALSSFLDNAPTYLTFLGTGLGNFFAGMPESEAVPRLIAEHATVLKAVSCGAVFMGANTYIGNAPNFMVRSIAEEQGIRMPSFFGYMAYSILILIPSFILATLVFF